MRRVFNFLHLLMFEGLDEKKSRALERELEEPLERSRRKRVGQPPSWWKGEDEAAAQAMKVAGFVKGVQT